MKIKSIAIVLTAAALLGALPLSACSREERRSEVYTDLFDTVIEVIGYGDAGEHFPEIRAIFEKYHRESDIYNEYDGMNNAATLNKNAGIAPVGVSEELFGLLEFGKQAYAESMQTVNIMMGAALRVWETYRTEGKTLPPDGLLDGARVSIDLLILDGEDMTAYISDADASVDLGAIAKGYAVGKVNEYLNENKISGVLINAGGNVSAVGTKPGGKEWTVGIQDPRGQSGEYVKALPVSDLCVVTSGDYQRYYTVDGKRYCHIIDPETLYPGTKYQSVSVICKDSAVADMLSTALFLLDEEPGRELLRRYSAKAVIVTPDGGITEIG